MTYLFRNVKEGSQGVYISEEHFQNCSYSIICA